VLLNSHRWWWWVIVEMVWLILSVYRDGDVLTTIMYAGCLLLRLIMLVSVLQFAVCSAALLYFELSVI